MFYLQLRNGYADDIEWSKLFLSFAAISLCIIIASILVLGLFKLEAKDEYDHRQRCNAKVTEFNALPLEHRMVIAKWNNYEVNENFFQSYMPDPTPKIEKFRKVIPYFIILELVLASFEVFKNYDEQKAKQYFYADFPSAGFKSHIALALMWVAWPIFFVSYIRMQRWKAEHTTGTEVNQTSTETEDVTEDAKEDTNDDAIDCEDVTYEDLSIKHSNFAEDSCAQYIEYCQDLNRYNYEERLSEAQNNVHVLEQNLHELGRKVQERQNEIKHAKIELEEIENSKPVEPQTPDVLESDWEAIKNMRGVTNIYCRTVHRVMQLFIEVEIRVPYEGNIYDFGDYRIEIERNMMICSRTRSGVKDNWSDGCYPDYCYSDETFCFGDRADKIQEYLTEQQLREAIILIIDCLHSVNDEYDALRIPDCFRRIVSPKEGIKNDTTSTTNNLAADA